MKPEHAVRSRRVTAQDCMARHVGRVKLRSRNIVFIELQGKEVTMTRQKHSISCKGVVYNGSEMIMMVVYPGTTGDGRC